MHLKRQKTPKSWPIKRKGTKYVVAPNSNLRQGIPLLIILRDILNLASNRKEVKKILREGQVMINDKIARNEKEALTLFDKIILPTNKKYYNLIISEKGRFELEDISEKDSLKKISKIIDKKMLKNKMTQINLIDGRNYINNISCEVNDSIVIDLKGKKIEKCLPLKEKSKVIVFSGKHSGKKGIVININKEKKTAEIEAKEDKINVLIKQMMVIE